MNRAVLGLITLFVCVYLLPLNARPLAIPDEMRYGEIAREMIESGNFIVPHLNGLRYFEKPAGGHILNACAMLAFGETNFAVRFTSTLATALSAIAVFLLVLRHSQQQMLGGRSGTERSEGSPGGSDCRPPTPATPETEFDRALVRRSYSGQTGFLAAFIFLTCAEVMGVGTFSVLDSMLSCCVTLSIGCFYLAINASGKKRFALLALSGVFVGGAFLVKGFIAFAVPVVVIGPYLALRRQWKELFTLTWIPLAVAAVVSLPWSLAIASQEPDFWRYFFWEEHIRRYFAAIPGQHKFPFWFFVPVFLGGTLPWSFIGPLPIRDLIRQRKSEPLIQFTLLWMIMPFLFFSCSSGKLGTYILPCFAPFAILTAIALTDRFESHHTNRSLQTGAVLTCLTVILSIVTTLVIAALYALGKIPPLDVYYIAKTVGWLIGLSIALMFAVDAYRSSSGLRKTIMLGLTTAAIFVTGSFCIPTAFLPTIGIQGILESEQHYIEPDTIIVANARSMHAVCYVYKRNDVFLFQDQGEVTYGLSYPEAEDRYLKVPALQSMIESRGSQRLVMVMNSSPDDAFRKVLAPPDYQRQWLNIWFAVYEPQTRK